MNTDIKFLFYRLKNDNRVHIELNTETKEKLYSIVISPQGGIIYNMVNVKAIDVLPVTPKTKKLLKFFNENKNLIVKLLEQANLNKKIDENFNRLWWLLKEETERVDL